ncbi:hypothetical protein OIDMADRAFT_143527 [Oidiodendron maius Zn]|uniref:Uncharacterized protein n=1 Tax=Oidiodendron maius (strain Zn) TaxID=913774 RepID=A0A0C3CYG4_OIDMZ|nr:hypothetical protein OIDMADRAFT_143527 [Oidiodendron maius Zn]
MDIFWGRRGGRKEKERRGKRESVMRQRENSICHAGARTREMVCSHAGRRTTTAGIDWDAQVYPSSIIISSYGSRRSPMGVFSRSPFPHAAVAQQNIDHHCRPLPLPSPSVHLGTLPPSMASSSSNNSSNNGNASSNSNSHELPQSSDPELAQMPFAQMAKWQFPSSPFARNLDPEPPALLRCSMLTPPFIYLQVFAELVRYVPLPTIHERHRHPARAPSAPTSSGPGDLPPPWQ